MNVFGDVNLSVEKCFKRIREENEKACAVVASDNRQEKRTPRKCFRCGSEDHLIAKCPKAPKENKKRRRQVQYNKRGNRACNNGKNNSDQKIYASMAHMSGNKECLRGNFGDTSQLTN